jgi:hypothetical protein
MSPKKVSTPGSGCVVQVVARLRERHWVSWLFLFLAISLAATAPGCRLTPQPQITLPTEAQYVDLSYAHPGEPPPVTLTSPEWYRSLRQNLSDASYIGNGELSQSPLAPIRCSIVSSGGLRTEVVLIPSPFWAQGGVWSALGGQAAYEMCRSRLVENPIGRVVGLFADASSIVVRIPVRVGTRVEVDTGEQEAFLELLARGEATTDGPLGSVASPWPRPVACQCFPMPIACPSGEPHVGHRSRSSEAIRGRIAHARGGVRREPRRCPVGGRQSTAIR